MWDDRRNKEPEVSFAAYIVTTGQVILCLDAPANWQSSNFEHANRSNTNRNCRFIEEATSAFQSIEMFGVIPISCVGVAFQLMKY